MHFLMEEDRNTDLLIQMIIFVEMQQFSSQIYSLRICQYALGSKQNPDLLKKYINYGM